MSPPRFSDEFRRQFRRLLVWRRDVRRFLAKPVDLHLIADILGLACLAPSVGNSQPWRFVMVNDPGRRAQVLETFRRSNHDALAAYPEAQATLYSKLKLSGLAEAPCHVAVFIDEATSAGDGLGRRTMPETLQYSAVAAIQVFWLAARTHGLGVGWVSILDPAEVVRALEVPPSWLLVAYLCVGYPVRDEGPRGTADARDRVHRHARVGRTCRGPDGRGVAPVPRENREGLRRARSRPSTRRGQRPRGIA